MDYSFSDFLEENKPKIILVLIIIFISVVLMIGSGFLDNKNEAEELDYRLESLGIVYYEQLYYDSIEGAKDEYLDMMKDVGININLSSLILNIYNEDPGFFVNNETNEKCDYEKSYVVIYPKKPYGKKDYEIEYKLECGF